MDLPPQHKNQNEITSVFFLSPTLSLWNGTNCSRCQGWRSNSQWQLLASYWTLLIGYYHSILACSQCLSPSVSWQVVQPHVKDKEFLKLTVLTDLCHETSSSDSPEQCVIWLWDMWNEEFVCMPLKKCVFQWLPKKIPVLNLSVLECLCWHVDRYLL